MSGATTGKLGVYSHIQKVFQNQRVGNLKIINPKMCDNKFRNYLFFALTNTILKLAYGGAQPNISSAKLLSLSCSLPPLAEQKRIVKKIEELFAIIDKTVKSLNETKEELAQYRQSVLQQAFSGKLHKTTVWNQILLREAVDINPKTTVPALAETDLVSFLPMSVVSEESLPLSPAFSRQEHWSALPFPSPIPCLIHLNCHSLWSLPSHLGKFA